MDRSAISRREALIGLGTSGALLSAAVSGKAQAPLRIGGLPVSLRLTAVTRDILRLSLAKAASASGATALSDDPVLDLASQGRVLLKDEAVGPWRSLGWEDRRVRVKGSPLTVEIERQDGRTVQSLRIEDDGTVTFNGSLGPVFGLGEGGPQFDRRGRQYTMHNGQFEPALATLGARVPIPWLVSADGWAIFFHQPYGEFDLTGPRYVFEQSATAVEDPVPLDLFVAVTNRPEEALQAYAQITGFPHMPPLWAVGYQQSHRTLSSRDEVLTEAEKFRDDKLPCDTMIYLGTGFCPSGWNTGHGSFTFNPRVFPDPKQIINKLHDQHFHVVLHLTKPPLHLHGRVNAEGAAAHDMSSAAFYWAKHLDDFRLGVDGWWPDEGDPLAPEARLARNRMYWEGPIKERPNERPFALHRNGYAGLQRYGWLWSGDVDCTWKTLRQQIPVGLNAGLSGIPYWGTDTGGFVPTKELTGELFVRWFQFSAFCPLFRSHGRNWKLRLPWGWNTGSYGPMEVDSSMLPGPEELHDAQVEPICRKYLDLRYRLLPYTYSAVRETHETGLPLMRALWIHYPSDARAIASAYEYLWGRDMLIAPVTEAGATSKEVYLPEGVWYEFWTGERLHGGQTLTRQVDLATIPIYVRAGAVLPLGPVKQYVEEPSDGPLVLRVHPGASGTSYLYADDGRSFDYERGVFMRLLLTWDDTASRLAIELAPGSKEIWPEYKKLQIELTNGREPRLIELDNNRTVVQL